MLTVERTTTPRQKQEKSTLVFGQTFTDHMLHLDWDDQGGWRGPRIAPYGDLSISPAASSLHYALQVRARGSRTTICMTGMFVLQSVAPPSSNVRVAQLQFAQRVALVLYGVPLCLDSTHVASGAACSCLPLKNG